MPITLRSDAFADQQRIPIRFTGDGADVSPALEWSGLPDGTRELALICVDPDAPTPTPWVHWVLYKLPDSCRQLPEGVSGNAAAMLAWRALQGRNSWNSGRVLGYRGPAPPRGHGVHHYHFQLFALDAALPVSAGLTADELRRAMDGHILGKGELVGLYSR